LFPRPSRLRDPDGFTDPRRVADSRPDVLLRAHLPGSRFPAFRSPRQAA
jgi:hypothetical protein